MITIPNVCVPELDRRVTLMLNDSGIQIGAQGDCLIPLEDADLPEASVKFIKAIFSDTVKY